MLEKRIVFGFLGDGGHGAVAGADECVRWEGHDVFLEIAERLLEMFWAGCFSHRAGKEDIATDADVLAESLDEIGSGGGEVAAGLE